MAEELTRENGLLTLFGEGRCALRITSGFQLNEFFQDIKYLEIQNNLNYDTAHQVIKDNNALIFEVVRKNGINILDYSVVSKEYKIENYLSLEEEVQIAEAWNNI